MKFGNTTLTPAIDGVFVITKRVSWFIEYSNIRAIHDDHITRHDESKSGLTHSDTDVTQHILTLWIAWKQKEHYV